MAPREGSCRVCRTTERLVKQPLAGVRTQGVAVRETSCA